jgi:hypothetical protein
MIRWSLPSSNCLALDHHAVPMLEHAEKSSTAERKLRLRPAEGTKVV